MRTGEKNVAASTPKPVRRNQATPKCGMHNEAAALTLANVNFHRLTVLRDAVRAARNPSAEELEFASLFDDVRDQISALAPEVLAPPDAATVRAAAEWDVAEWERRARVTENALYIWKAIDQSFSSELPLSAFCLSYIRSIAFELSPLIDDAMARTPEIDQAKAIEAVPRALKITSRQGALNAFGRLHRDCKLQTDANHEDEARLEGQKPKHPETEERNLRRRIKKGRELRGWPKPPPKP